MIGPLETSYPGGYKAIIMAADMLSRYVVVAPVRAETAEALAHFLIEQIIFKFGVPSVVLLDNASINRGHVMEELTRNLGIHLQFITPYSHRGNLSERRNRICENVLAALIQEAPKNSWHLYLPMAAWVMNSFPCRTTGLSPFEVTFGHYPRGPLEATLPALNYPDDYPDKMHALREVVKLQILESQEEYRNQYNKTRKFKTYKVGDYVYVWFPSIKEYTLSRKLNAKYLGKYVITAVLSHLNYRVKNLENQREHVVHIRRLKPFKPLTNDLKYQPNYQSPQLRTSRTHPPPIHETPEQYLPENVHPLESLVANQGTDYRTRYGRVVKPVQSR